MVLYIYGADTFRSRQYLKEQIERFKIKRDPNGYNVIFVPAQGLPRLESGKAGGSAPGEEESKILSEIKTAPFLGEKRLVVLENLLSNNNKELLGAFKDLLKEPELSNVIIIWQGGALSKVQEAKELDALLKKQKYAKGFELLKGAQLRAWIASEVKQRGGKINSAAVDLLQMDAGKDTWLLNSLIDELVAYAGNNEITEQDARLFVEQGFDDNIFSLTDAIAGGNRPTAFKLLEYQRQLGEEEGKIFGLLVWQFRILLEMGDALERDSSLTSDLLAKQVGLHPFVAKKNMAVARRTPLARLQELYKELLVIDIKTKTGAAPQSLLIDLFIGKI